ncbi:Selenoprotein T2 [Trichinella pseudospiralis]|uniref:Selenoprotein T2 n=1 Tax=Trichinella pseudospiralis TaxID=6337 RepID=A0A0V1ECA5_TRIPS|nr:Selenoprotein T2 [Trichinella pseudospiralis]KRY89219.1 Selenoprotein T2 [Trichinella pseudospiralis]
MSSVVFCVLSIFAVLSLRDLTYSDANLKQENMHPDEDEPKRGAGKMAPQTITFLYWYTYIILFLFICDIDNYARLIQSQFPGVVVKGETYPPPPYKATVAEVIRALKIVLILCILFEVDLAFMLNISMPPIYVWAMQNKISACLMLFFMSTAIENYLLSTGAFEIFMNDIPLWSKLDVGRIPQITELFGIINAHLNLSYTLS